MSASQALLDSKLMKMSLEDILIDAGLRIAQLERENSILRQANQALAAQFIGAAMKPAKKLQLVYDEGGK